MFFRTTSECVAYAQGCRLTLDPNANAIDRNPLFPNEVKLSFVDDRGRSFALARQIAKWLGAFDTCVLLVTEFGIWPSSENLHLYYAVRRSYGDTQELRDAPGHMFLKHETADLVTFLDMTVQFGWGGLLFGVPQETCVAISHDEWIHIRSEIDTGTIAEEAEEFGLTLLAERNIRKHS